LNINTNHPTFITFIENVNKNILSNITLEKYFLLTEDKKTALQYLVLKLILKSVKVRAKLTDSELFDFTKILQKKNEELENYEFAGLLNDMTLNFNLLCEMLKTPPTIRKKRPINTDKSKDV
jgi:hypothetical protein